MPKTTRNPDCIGGHDFRDQNDAQQSQKTRLPEAGREGVNASLIRGKTRTASKKQRRKMHVQSAGGPGGAWRSKRNLRTVGGKKGRPELTNPVLKVVKRGFKAEMWRFLGIRFEEINCGFQRKG